MVPEYKHSLIIYYDILGFKKIVETRTAAEVGAILSAFKETSKVSPDEQELFEKVYTNFSDTVIISINLLGENNLKDPSGIFFNELMNIVHIQNELLRRKIILRGVMTFGEIFHNSDLFYGPGVISAHEKESSVANYPRIIIDPSVIEVYLNTPVLKADIHNIEEDKEYVYSLLRKDSDDFLFVDYLKAFSTELDNPGDYNEVLLEHKCLVIDNAKRFSNVPKVLAKYLWMAKYHNQVVSEKKQPGVKSEFLITQNDIPSLPIV